MIRSLLLLAVASWPLLSMTATAADLRILTTGAYRSVLRDLAPAIEGETGHRLIIQNETAGAVVQRVRAGERFDLVIVTPAGARSLGGLLGAATPLGRVGIGVAVPVGAPKPAIATEADIRAAVLDARAPAWIAPDAGGSSGIYLSHLWEKWGIAPNLARKAVLVKGGLVADVLHDGSADLAFQQMSELMGHGVMVVGPLPASIQNYTVYVGAVPANAANRMAAADVLSRLGGEEARAALEAHGMEAP